MSDEEYGKLIPFPVGIRKKKGNDNPAFGLWTCRCDSTVFHFVNLKKGGFALLCAKCRLLSHPKEIRS